VTVESRRERPSPRYLEVVSCAFETFGVEFIDEDGAGPEWVCVNRNRGNERLERRSYFLNDALRTLMSDPLVVQGFCWLGR
jgi:hypothetical protein